MGRREKLESVLLSTRRDLSFRAQKAIRRAQRPAEELAEWSIDRWMEIKACGPTVAAEIMDWLGQDDGPTCLGELKVADLTLRDYFAAAALPQLLGEERRGVAVEYAYDVADLMLKERALSPEERQREDHE